MECLFHCLARIFILRCRCLIECRPDEARWRRHIAGNAMHTSTAAKGFELHVAHLARVYGTRLQVHIVIEIGQMPFKARRIGQHPKSVFIEVQFLAHYLQYHLSAALLCYPPMYGRAARIDGHDMYIGNGCLHLVYSFKVREYPRHELQVADRILLLCGIVCFIFSVFGKIEEACG